MKIDKGLAAAIGYGLLIGVLCVVTSGCTTTPKYGDGKLGNIPLDPAVNSLTTALNKQFPGSGDYVGRWFETSGADRVPPGYMIKIKSILDGKQINRADIIDIPYLVPKTGTPLIIVNDPLPETPDQPDDPVVVEETPEDIIEDIK